MKYENIAPVNPLIKKEVMFRLKINSNIPKMLPTGNNNSNLSMEEVFRSIIIPAIIKGSKSTNSKR